MADMKRTANEIVTAMREADKRKPSAYDTTAEVRRIEHGTAWVHIPGGVDETPAALTIDADVGDTVQVRVAGGSAWIVGNQTAPPTSDKVAKEALKAATSAKAEVGSAMSSDIMHYLVTDLDSGVTVDTPGWSDEPQEMTEELPYLWTYHTYTFANGNTVDSEPVLTGVYGQTGPQGPQGEPGEDGQPGANGVSVTQVQSQYYLSTSSSSATGGSWQNSLPAYVSGRYYWTREKITYSNGTTGYAPSSSGVYSPGLTKSVQLSYDTAQHFWVQPTASATTNVPTGAYVTEQTESDYKSNPTGGATLIRSDKVDIRVGTKTYSRFDGNGTHIYDGNGTATSNLLAEFTGSGVAIYKNGSAVAQFGTTAVFSSGNVKTEIGAAGLVVTYNNADVASIDDDGKVYTQGHSVPIGHVIRKSGTWTIPANSTGAWSRPTTSQVPSITLTAGTWIVNAQVSIGQGTSPAGRRGFRLYNRTTAAGDGDSQVNALPVTGADSTQMVTSRIFEVDSTTNITAEVWSNGTASNTAVLNISAVCIA